MYDLIGDIHGYALGLKALLTKMDYRQENGTWVHPGRPQSDLSWGLANESDALIYPACQSF